MKTLDASRLAAMADGMTDRTFVRAMERIGGPAQWLAAERGSWIDADLPAAAIDARQPTPRPLPRDVRAWALGEPDFPVPRGTAVRPPIVLFGRGRALPLPARRRCIAIIGSRHATDAGLTIARDLAAGLAAHGLVVVSGLAMGIDAAAHEGALDAGGVTVAVLPSPIDRPAPQRHSALADSICAGGGALVSERPPSAQVRPEDFPQRNRLVAALSAAVIVVEAGLRSGTMSTVRYALDSRAEVGAVPGSPLSAAAAGTNALIAAGAPPILSVADALALLGRARAALDRFDPDERSLLAAIPGAVAAADRWVGQAALPAEAARAAMLRLIARGALRRLPDGRVGRVFV